MKTKIVWTETYTLEGDFKTANESKLLLFDGAFDTEKVLQSREVIAIHMKRDDDTLAYSFEIGENRCERGHDEPASGFVDGHFICDMCKYEFDEIVRGV